MKTKVIKSIKHASLLLILLLIGYSCSDDPVQNIDFQETQFNIINIQVKKADWKWDNVSERFEAVKDLPELTKFIYENGVQLGYVFIGQQGSNEVQKILPFVNTYKELAQGNTFIYTETISCDFMLGTPSSVAFYIQSSDLEKDEFNLADYNFRIVLVY
ncbi:MAG: hypothetical protein ACOH2V_02635 [Candidatus Saccharimonadaceae bacterium]